MARGASSETGNQTPVVESDSQHIGKGEDNVNVADAETQQDVPMETSEAQTESADAMVDVEHRRSDHEREEEVSALPGAKMLYKLRTDRKYHPCIVCCMA